MPEVTLEELQEIQKQLNELKKLREEVSMLSSDNLKLKRWILERRTQWSKMNQMEEELQSRKNRIQSLEKTWSMKGELIEAYENGFQTNREELACERSNLKRKELDIRKAYADLREKQDKYYKEKMKLNEKEKALEEREHQVRSREDVLKRDMRGVFERTKREAKKDFEWIYPITQDMIILLIGIFILSSIENGFFSDMIGLFKCMHELFLSMQNVASTLFGQDPLIVKFLTVGLIGWILPLLIVALCIVISGYFTYRYYNDYLDSTSRRYLLANLAFCVFILGIVKRHSSISLNSFLVFFVLQNIYILARAIIDMKNDEGIL